MKEILLTTCQNEQKTSIVCWDYKSCNKLQTYNNGGTAAAKTLSSVADEYLLTAELNKPLLHVWPVNSQEEVKNARLILPEPARALHVSPSNGYLAVGISNKLYVWNLASGELLSVTQKHYQDITCVRFSSDSDFLVAGGQDGMLVAYNVGSLICTENNYLKQSSVGQAECLYTKLDHSLAITDVFVGDFGATSRLASVSGDQTCRLYTLITGDALLTLVFQAPLTTTIFDRACWSLYVGDSAGAILHFNLRNPPRSLQHHVDKSGETDNCFSGHQKKVNCLDLNAANDNLISGGDDRFVFVWEIESRQILRKIEHQGAVLNVKFSLGHKYALRSLNFDFVVKPLKRSLDVNPETIQVTRMQSKTLTFERDICDDDESANEIDSLKFQLDAANEKSRVLYGLLIKSCNSAPVK